MRHHFWISAAQSRYHRNSFAPLLSMCSLSSGNPAKSCSRALFQPSESSLLAFGGFGIGVKKKTLMGKLFWMSLSFRFWVLPWTLCCYAPAAPAASRVQPFSTKPESCWRHALLSTHQYPLHGWAPFGEPFLSTHFLTRLLSCGHPVKFSRV